MPTTLAEMSHHHMVPVALASTAWEAKLLAARLGAEGMLWELRGEVDSPYPFGSIEVLVEAEHEASARLLLMPVPNTFDLDGEIEAGEVLDYERAPLALWLVVSVILVISLTTLLRTLVTVG